MSESATAGSSDDGDTYTELLRWAYEGEVFGQVFLAQLLRADIHAGHRVKLEALHRLEARTRDVLLPLIKCYGISVDEAAVRRVGEDFAATVRQMSWGQFMAETQKVAREALPKFRKLKQQADLVGAPDDLPALAELVAHEEALHEFARLEAEGSSSAAMEVLQRHLAASR